ncbi:MAG: MMPL family transporter [Proteobacteria bacterium]|nr:MMPL family transporter [Pseudomonadota bacterium]MBU1641405.1 MMPL family transporter [Pseudomonadota bacterium]
MKLGSRLVQIPILRPKLVTALLVIFTLALGALISKVHVDTDPENMLSEHEDVRLFHTATKKEFALHDVLVLGVVNETHPDGVFNPETLGHVFDLTEYASTLADPNNPEYKVVAQNIIAPSNVDAIIQAGLGQVSFDWLMAAAPTTQEEALRIRDLAMDNPLFKGTLVSEDGKAIGIYLPITSKKFAHTLSQQLNDKIATLSSNGDKFFITGLPVAEDTFGKEMFIQMAVSAPLAMLAIFLLMLYFFKQLRLIISPMIVAMVAVISTMGLLIGTGHTLHIMSSMIPIFLMPIAVVDSIHIMSEFFDEYQKTGDRRKTIEHVISQLFTPMLYTSLTSAAGFASLAMTPIPPVQAFGIFVAIGIMIAWITTIIFIPAYIMMMPESSLQNFGVKGASDSMASRGAMACSLRTLGRFVHNWPKLIISTTMLLTLVAFYGISQIQVNDNPVKWFTKNHEIRVADQVLNKHFRGTYEAFLILESNLEKLSPAQAETELATMFKNQAVDENSKAVVAKALAILTRTAQESTTDSMLSLLEANMIDSQNKSNDLFYDIWADLVAQVDTFRNRDQIFKRPDVLRYIENLQAHLLEIGVVGKTSSISDVVKKVHKELFESNPEHYIIPDSVGAVAQCLISFQNSHKPDDLYHLVTPDYQKANIWVQLQNGDNKVMETVVKEVKKYMIGYPPPVQLNYKWAGLTYLNVVWQDKMVSGMRDAFLSSFIIVFIMMVLLFRSPTWGLLAMIPLTMTIAWIYGIIGFIGKDYDMPVAVLSSLTLGLAVDFAIHFLERARATQAKTGSWTKTITAMFEEPARAISRNVIVIAIGFTPLLLAPLVPYKTVGVFLASIMAISGLATMLILPALITILQGWLFRKKHS